MNRVSLVFPTGRPSMELTEPSSNTHSALRSGVIRRRTCSSSRARPLGEKDKKSLYNSMKSVLSIA